MSFFFTKQNIIFLGLTFSCLPLHAMKKDDSNEWKRKSGFDQVLKNKRKSWSVIKYEMEQNGSMTEISLNDLYECAVNAEKLINSNKRDSYKPDYENILKTIQNFPAVLSNKKEVREIFRKICVEGRLELLEAIINNESLVALLFDQNVMESMEGEVLIDKSFKAAIEGNYYEVLDAACGNKNLLLRINSQIVFSVLCYALEHKDALLTFPLLVSKVDFCKKLWKFDIINIFTKLLEKGTIKLLQAFLGNKYFLLIVREAINDGQYDLPGVLLKIKVEKGVLMELLKNEGLWAVKKQKSQNVFGKVKNLFLKIDNLLNNKKSPEVLVGVQSQNDVSLIGKTANAKK